LSAARALQALGADFVMTDSRTDPPGLAALRAECPGAPLFLGGFDPAAFAPASAVAGQPWRFGEDTGDCRSGGARRSGLGRYRTAGPVDPSPDCRNYRFQWQKYGNDAAGPDGGARWSPGGCRRQSWRRRRSDLWLQQERKTGNAPDCYVLELSSFQLETTHSLNARVTTVLNISPDHLDRYDGLDDYIAAKQRIFRGDGVMVVNADDPAVMAMVEPDRDVRRFHSRRSRAEGEFGLRRDGGETWLACGRECWIAAAELKIRGDHNLANALAALAMGQALGWRQEGMLAALREFTGLAHRTALVLDRDGVRWFDDSKGTNVGATVAAVRGLPGQVVLIAGGEGKNQDFTPLRAALADKARAVVLIGRDAPLIAAALGDSVPLHPAMNLDQAVAAAAELAQPGDSVLLSPACASFDMFSGYEERGAVFAAAVRRWAGC
jgi:UDP-N-acetylmuramoylalanine--D-glutamate ligase